MMPIVGTAVLALCAALGSWLDMTSRRLPNWLCLATAFAGLCFVAFELGTRDLAWAAVHAALALIVGMGLFRFGVVGGGDAKFYAGCAAWWPIQKGLALLLWVSLAGLALVIVWFSFKRLRRALDESEKSQFAMVPYGVAISVGAVLTRALA